MKTLQERVDELAGDEGWWKSDTGEVFQRTADFLKDKGLSDDEILDVLESCLSAAREEYGE